MPINPLYLLLMADKYNKKAKEAVARNDPTACLHFVQRAEIFKHAAENFDVIGGHHEVRRWLAEALHQQSVLSQFVGELVGTLDTALDPTIPPINQKVSGGSN